MIFHRAIVTGGGTGLGSAIARLLASEGGEVLVTGRTLGTLEETAAGAEGIYPFAADVRSEAGVQQAIHRAEELWGTLTLLVNNAGVFRSGLLGEGNAADARLMWETNVLGPTLMARAALPLLRQSRGCIINISSTTAQKATPSAGEYAASKAALEHLTRVWALELAENGIRVNCVRPGPTETGILDRSGLAPERVRELKAEDCRQIPLGRRGTAEEVAWWVARLADPVAGWTTGAVVGVDGGLGAA